MCVCLFLSTAILIEFTFILLFVIIVVSLYLSLCEKLKQFSVKETVESSNNYSVYIQLKPL